MAIAADIARRVWTLPLARAVVAAAVGCVVTFSPDHSPAFGLAVFGGFAIATGAIWLTSGLRAASGPALAARSLAAGSAAVTLLAGVAALIALPVAHLFSFIALVAGWALVSGALEFASGRRLRGLVARDAAVVGGGTMLLGAALGLLPPNPVVSVGLLGAYAVMVSVYLAIAAFSLKWARGADAVSAGGRRVGRAAAGGRTVVSDRPAGTDPVIPPTPTPGGNR